MSLFQGPKNKNATSAPRQNNEEATAVQPTNGSTPEMQTSERIRAMATEHNERRMARIMSPAAGTKTEEATTPTASVASPTEIAPVITAEPVGQAAPETALAPEVAQSSASPSPTPETPKVAPTKKDFLEAVGANKHKPEKPDTGPTKKDFFEAIGANKHKPEKPDSGPTKKDFLEAVGANKHAPEKPDTGPTKKDFLEAVGANKHKPEKPDTGPTKKDFLEAVGANKHKPAKPDTGPTKKDFLAAIKTPSAATPASASAPASAETPALSSETALTETPTLAPALETAGGAGMTETPTGANPPTAEAAPEAQAPEAQAPEEVPAEALPTGEVAAEAGAPGEGEGDGKKEKPKAEREKSKGFLAAVANIKKTAEEQAEHAPAQDLSVEAQAAAEVPENESMGDAQAAQVDEMAEQEPVEFSAANFKALLMDRIKQMELPDTAEKADDFENNNNIEEVNEASKEDVQKEKDTAAGPIKSTNEKAPDPSAQPQRVADPLAPLDPGKKVKSAKANKAVPDPRPDSEVSQPIQEETAKLDDNMAANNVTDKQLEISQEPKFVKGLEGKNEAKAEAQKSTEQMRQQEAGTLQQTGEKAEGTSQEQLAGMNLMRGSSLQQVAGGQQTAGTKDTTEREKVAIKIDEIFAATQTDVAAILDTLDTDVNSKFEAATERAKKSFEDHVEKRMEWYKYERYFKYVGGAALWLVDAVMGMPDEVNEFFVEGRQVFIDEMDKEITIISEIVATKLNEAKQRVETGKQEVTDYVNSLPANLKAVGKEAADDIQDKFDQLTEDVNAKQDELVDSMADQYQAALEEVDERIEEMKAANRGLVGMVMDMINGIIETIRKLTEAINNLLSAIAGVIGIIMADPIGFMELLFDGIGKGIDMFKANIQKHLLGGLLEWLTGSLGPMGITVPDDIFSLGGIFNLVMQVLGLGWDFLRAKSVKMMGEPMVNALETGFDMFKIFASKGIDGIWEFLKESFTDLKETVIDAIKSMLITQVIEAGIKWLLSLLIPGAGFIKAIMAIKDIIVFFVESAIMLIPAITEAILALAAGSIAGVGKAIEFGLAKLLPLVIGLFAKLIGLGGLSKRVMKIFKKIRKRVDKAVNKLLKKAKKAGRKLMRKLGIGKKKKKGKKPEDDDDHNGSTIKPQSFKMNRRKHTLKYEGGEIMMQSKSGRLVDKIKAARKFVEENPEAELIKGKAPEILASLDQLELDRKAADKALKKATKRKDGDEKDQAIKEANALQKGLANDIESIGNTYKLIDLQSDYGTDEFDGDLQVGLHTLKAPDRESHHVAENKFMEQTKEFYKEVGTTLMTKPGFEKLGEKLMERYNSIKGKFPEGENLSAILLHKDTHRLAIDKAIHSIQLQPSAMTEITEDAKLNKTIVVVGVDKDTDTRRAQMNEGAWNSFIKKVFQMTAKNEFEVKSSDQQLVIKSIESDDNALKDISSDLEKLISQGTSGPSGANVKVKQIQELINDTAKNAFESALSSSLNTVKAALGKSTSDGKKEDHPKALSQLRNLALKVWRNHIIGPIK